MPKKANAGLALVKTVLEFERTKAKVDSVFWSGPLTPEKSAKLSTLKRRRDQLQRRISQILQAMAKATRTRGRTR